MTDIDDDWTEQEVREDTVDDLLKANDLDDLQRMRREMREKLEATSDDREADLLRYRLDILGDAIDRTEQD
jgi:hypothetical protein